MTYVVMSDRSQGLALVHFASGRAAQRSERCRDLGSMPKAFGGRYSLVRCNTLLGSRPRDK